MISSYISLTTYMLKPIYDIHIFEFISYRLNYNMEKLSSIPIVIKIYLQYK